MIPFLSTIARALARHLPRPLVEAVKTRLVDPVAYQRAAGEAVARSIVGEALDHDGEGSMEGGPTIGILMDADFYFCYNIAACLARGLRYRRVDLDEPDWMDLVRDARCDYWLVYPSSSLAVQKLMHDEKLLAMERDLGCRLVPRFDELWMWESKRRMHLWLAAHGVPHPRTLVFSDRDAARAHALSCSLPVVLKTDIGAGSSGVVVAKTREEATRLVERMFGKGVIPKGMHSANRQWGYVVIQDFVPHDHEYRVVRIGRYFLCRRKTRVGDFASGAGRIDWHRPEPEVLDFVEALTDRGGFRSMAVDLFIVKGEDGRDRYLVNELQALFGRIENEKKTNEAMGRWYRGEDGSWSFESGYFYQHACADLRVEMILDEWNKKDAP